MIKFWKSAAKGKTGCPVRPPENKCDSDVQSSGSSLKLENNIDGYKYIFEKKSKLTLNMNDILKNKSFVKNFMLFMDSLGKQNIIKCWLELENLRLRLMTSISNQEEKENQNKLNHTKSLDVHCACVKSNGDISYVAQHWRTSISNLKKSKSLCTRSSSVNLNDNSICHVEDCSLCEDKQCDDFTQEAIRLFKKYVALEAPYPLELPDSLRKVVISNICQPAGQIQVDCFKPIQEFLFHEMETTYYSQFENNYLYTKCQIDILTDGSINLQDILYCDLVLFNFTEYLEQESCSILLEFLMAAMHFRDNMLNGNSGPEQAQGDAIVLYEKYFSLQASSPIGFPTEIRLQVESDICREEGPVFTCFDIPYIIIYKTLSNYVKTFLESDLYYTYLSEMVKSIEHACSTGCKSSSDCSSEYSMSTQNTLLAMGDPLYKKRRNRSVPDMTIDSNQLYNGDALWQRKKHDGLSLGRINSLGRFESKLEPDPDKKDNSILKRVVRKFVPTNTLRVEEEMAWQIAHMIVKDVTDLTMAPPDNDNEE
ncbi:unnamed protein product [Leptidea sinapis]|uniref:RGS domain-containing protein n=1 Tax=Leptidea sinapis TaxID=189913 RepID=A0A5E4QMT4_9NEOP|nr:unnamed protein product [Leptidea sinapis]